MSILVVEDDLDLADVLLYMLRRAGYETIHAADGESAMRVFRQHKPALVLLDLGLPGVSGWEVCQLIRAESTIPILMLTAADEEEDVIRGLDLGADDYVTKPFSPRILLARIRTLLRLAQGEELHASSTLRFADLELNYAQQTFSCGQTSLPITKLEARVLRELVINSGQVVPHPELIKRVWGYQDESNSGLLKGHVRNLRLKLAAAGSRCYVRTILGVGYLLDIDSKLE